MDVLIIGGGPAGPVVATRLYEKGTHNILTVEQEKQLGGIFRQYTHDGFEPTCFKTTLSGPEYVQRFIDEAEELGTPYTTDAIVPEVTRDRTVTAAARQGPKVRKAKSVTLTMGYREWTRGALGIPSGRPIGVFTAGVAQAYINLCNVVPAKEVVILGSGDIGMIMAHRLTPKGTHVQATFETQPYPSGLLRNVEQCLSNYGTPSYLSYAVAAIHGDNRLAGVTVSRVGEHLRPAPGIGKGYRCDTLILSVDPIPEDELSLDADVILDNRVEGAMVDEHFQTDVEGIFVAGNMLHVHDLVNFVSMEAESLADSATKYVQNGCLTPCLVRVGTDSHINHAVSQKVSGTRDFKLSLRANSPLKECSIEVRQDGVLVALRRMEKVIPIEMIELIVRADKLVSPSRLEVSAKC